MNMERIFFWVFNAILVAWFIWFINWGFRHDEKILAETKQITKICYSRGQVVVRTDLGQRCADPRTLVEPK